MSTGKTKIQIARRQLGLDDETYRAILKRTAGVESSKDLNPRQIGRVLVELERLGFKPKASTGRAKPKPAAERAKLVGKIEAQLAEAGRAWEYADSLAKRMYQVERLEWCDTDQLRGIVTALALDAKRHGRTL
ncbi:regulatory protein GemA [Pseudomonas berkeleyensis]|uniref:Regulatory protein GemA n=1 Tax=Pseudomonas berkeleyensis TaxID=2726956 RepID=A0A7G5DM28_9PSED|nr:regulatory protein GemA [Pseudomonas berkeleyensis]QMV62803.1 regulatory protein GemA [Pseudomonas berkeleyensis]WSO38257.1 regulatory protein GemA [Pseudomonas berkeleyensis]